MCGNNDTLIRTSNDLHDHHEFFKNNVSDSEAGDGTQRVVDLIWSSKYMKQIFQLSRKS